MTQPPIQDEAYLVSAARGGDFAAWKSLCAIHVPRLAAYLGTRVRRPSVIDQLVAETIIGAWRHLDELPTDPEFGIWFRKLGAGIAMRWARERPGEALEEAFPVARLPAGHERTDEVAALDQAIGTLDEQHRMALELRWRGGMSDVELGLALRVSPEAAKRLVDEAEAQLEQELSSAS